MDVVDLSWVLLCSREFEETVDFHRRVLGLPLRDTGVPVLDHRFSRYAAFPLASGTVLEVVEPRDELGGAVPSLTVDDLSDAAAPLRRHGAQVLGDPVRDPTGWAWIYVRVPGGIVYQLQGPQRR